MLDFRTQSQLIDATAAMMRSCLLATTNNWAASACRGFSLWAELMESGSRRDGALPAFGPMLWPSVVSWADLSGLCGGPIWQLPAGSASLGWTPFARTWLGPSFSLWAPLADWTAWSRASIPAWNVWLEPLAGYKASAFADAAGRSTTAEPPSYASYRSAGGHAVAQVIHAAEGGMASDAGTGPGR